MAVKIADPRHKYRDAQILPFKSSDLTDTLISISISVTDRCNRKCDICPHSKSFKVTESDMSIETAQSIASELSRIQFKGRVGLCGYGESTLHPNILDICSILKTGLHEGNIFEFLTNGDTLTVQMIRAIMATGVTFILVSLYDGEHQVKKFNDMFKEAHCEAYMLRKHWLADEITISNRCGAAYESREVKRECYFPFYKMAISSSGNVSVCDQDWNKCKEAKLGNVNSDRFMDLWLSDKMMQYRKRLINADRSQLPCNKCDVDGKMHGADSFNTFKKELEK